MKFLVTIPYSEKSRKRLTLIWHARSFTALELRTVYLCLGWYWYSTKCHMFKLRRWNEKSTSFTIGTFALLTKILFTFPTGWSIFRITLDADVMKKSHIHLLSISKWVKFMSVRLEMRAGLWHSIFTCYSKVRYTPNEDRLIVER